MTRELFEKTAKDLNFDLSYSERFKKYSMRETQKAWLMWNAALESKEAVVEPEEPIEVSVAGIHTAQLYFDWGQKGCGFGQLSIGKDADGKVHASTECMSRRWTRKALHAAIDVLVDAAELN